MLLADEPIAVCLEKWLEAPDNRGRTIGSGELNKALRDVASCHDIPWRYKSGQSLGQRLSHITTNLKERFQVEVEQDTSNQLWYRFSPKLNRLIELKLIFRRISGVNSVLLVD